MKNWTGDQRSIFKNLGASNHVNGERPDYDYYATHPHAVKLLLQIETLSNLIWEPACGGGHMSQVLENKHDVISTDLVNHGYGIPGVDFLKQAGLRFNGDIVTNPPYRYAQQFVEQSLDLVTEGHKVVMFLKIQFLEGKSRRKLFKNHPPRTVHVSSSRLRCVKNGDFEGITDASAQAYGWFVWVKGYKGNPVLKWFN